MVSSSSITLMLKRQTYFIHFGLNFTVKIQVLQQQIVTKKTYKTIITFLYLSYKRVHAVKNCFLLIIFLIFSHLRQSSIAHGCYLRQNLPFILSIYPLMFSLMEAKQIDYFCPNFVLLLLLRTARYYYYIVVTFCNYLTKGTNEV